MKKDRGRWFYRRRVPKRHHKTLGAKIWNRPCGNVSYPKAVSLATTWAEQHDALIAKLDNPATASKVRQRTEVRSMKPKIDFIISAMESGSFPGDPLEAAKAGLIDADQKPSFDDQDRLVRYRAILAASFGPHVSVSTDLDERDEYELVRRKLERRITKLAGDRNTITQVAERYYKFAQIKPSVRGKYRRNINKLDRHLGDIPLSHVTPSQLRDFRNAQAETMQVSALQSVFTPIKGLFNFAVGENLIEDNPMGSVKIQKDRRSVQA